MRMKNLIFAMGLILISQSTPAQFYKATLQASGLTCSLCSKAVKEALEAVPFVQEVKVDIKSQEYKIGFKENSYTDFDALQKAVEDAGFSVALLKITGQVSNVQAQQDKHVVMDGKNFHFLNGNNQLLNGEVTFTLAEKNFLAAKDLKKYSKASQQECVKSGKTGSCCFQEGIPSGKRIYHIVI